MTPCPRTTKQLPITYLFVSYDNRDVNIAAGGENKTVHRGPLQKTGTAVGLSVHYIEGNPLRIFFLIN